MSDQFFLEPSTEPCVVCGGSGGTFRVAIVTPDYTLSGRPMHVGCRTDQESLTRETFTSPTPKGGVPKARQKRASKQEASLASAVGGKTQKGSGNQLSAKGDVRKKGIFRLECKSTTNKSFSMTREILDKISSECLRLERPGLDVLFLNPTTLREEDRWVAIPFSDFEEYADYVSRKNQ